VAYRDFDVKIVISGRLNYTKLTKLANNEILIAGSV